MNRLMVASACIALSALGHAAPGDLDLSFGGTGLRTLDFAAGIDEARGLVPLADGSVIVVGRASNGGSVDFALARLKPDGQLDGTFGSSGIALADFGGYDEAFGIVRDHSGRLLLAGRNGASGSADFLVARFSADGVLDDSFGSGGQRKIDFAGGFDEARGLALQSTGAIIVGGRCSPDPADLAVKGFCATRVLDNGSIDLNFGVNGRATASYDAPALNGVYGMTVDDADRVVLVGHVNVSWAIVRFGAGGVIDGGFGSGGRSVVPFAALSLAIAVKARADGGLIVGGRAHSGGDQFALARLNAGGTLEGPVSFTDFSGATDVIMALDLDPSGRIYAAGFSAPSISGDNQFALARYDRQGALDTAFGSGGRVTTSVAAGSDVAYAVRVVGERLIVAGASGGDFGLARYVVDGDLLFANGFDGAR